MGQAVAKKLWWVYLVLCIDGTWYCGIARDTERRVRAHNNTKQGARYTRTRRPVILAWEEPCDSQSEALVRERQIKRMSHKQKHALVSSFGLLQLQLDEEDKKREKKT